MISECLSHCDVEKLSFSSVFFFDRLFTVPYFPLRSSRTNRDKCYGVVSNFICFAVNSFGTY